jgi:hypothetical protein
MSPPLAARHHSASSPKNATETLVAGARPTVRAAAANDDSAEVRPSITSDPLWGMAIASMILFALFAVLIAF